MRLIQKALTFDDILLVPAYSEVLPKDVDLATQLTRTLRIKIPIVSAAMDTVTEARLAIAIAQEGGIGIIHKNMPIKAQAAQVAQVKRFESGVVTDPIIVSPDMTVRKVLELIRQHNISGLPVVKSKKVVGIVTNRDLRFETNLDQPVKNIMTPKKHLVTVREGVSKEDALALLHKHRLEKALIVSENFELRGMITVKDITRTTEHPYASKDNQERLYVGAAIGVGEGSDERAAALVEAGADVIVVDTAHGHSQGVLDRVRWVKKKFPEIQVIAGNVATATAAKALVDHGADAVKVGSAPARSVPLASSRVSVCHKFQPSIMSLLRCWAQVYPSSPMGVSAILVILPRHWLQAQVQSCWEACWPEPKNLRVKSSCSREDPIKAIGAWALYLPCNKDRATAISRKPNAMRQINWYRKVWKDASLIKAISPMSFTS